MKAHQDNRKKERDARKKTADDMENYKNTPVDEPKTEPKKVEVVKTSEKPNEPEGQQDVKPKKPLPPPPEPEDGEEQTPSDDQESKDEVTVDTTPPPNGNEEGDDGDI